MAREVREYIHVSGGREIYIPDFIVPLWQIEFQEKHGIRIDREIAKVMMEAKYTESTWKWKRAMDKISNILASRGLTQENAMHFAKHLVELATQ